MYILLMLVGSIGLVAMTLLGFTHSGGARGAHGLGAHGGGHGHALPGHHGALPSGSHPSSAHPSNLPGQANQSGSTLSTIASSLILSPVDLFCLCLAGGATGYLLQSIVAGSLLPWLAVAGAIVFTLLVERPILNFAMRFVSKPSEGLEGIVAHTAIAVTSFDHEGRGLIKVTMDDQCVQILAVLDRSELTRGVKVAKNDEVVIVDVDTVKNSCHVTKELSL